jgi:hypothetical protein
MMIAQKVQTYSTFLPHTAGDLGKLTSLVFCTQDREAFQISIHVPRHKLSFKRLEITDETRQ